MRSDTSRFNSMDKSEVEDDKVVPIYREFGHVAERGSGGDRSRHFREYSREFISRLAQGAGAHNLNVR